MKLFFLLVSSLTYYVNASSSDGVVEHYSLLRGSSQNQDQDQEQGRLASHSRSLQLDLNEMECKADTISADGSIICSFRMYPPPTDTDPAIDTTIKHHACAYVPAPFSASMCLSAEVNRVNFNDLPEDHFTNNDGNNGVVTMPVEPVVPPTVNVTITTPPPTLTFSASSSSVEAANEFALTWSSTNTKSCTASGDWSGTKALSATQTITSASTGEKSYVLTCTGDAGSAAKTVNLTILEYSVVIATAKPNDATVKLLTEGFNQPLNNHPQWAIFSSDIDTYYVEQYHDIQNNVIQAFGRYPNYNYLTFDLDGSDSVNQPVLNRLIALKFVGWEGGYTTEELKSVASCLTGSWTNGNIKNANYEYHSICIQNIQFTMYGHKLFDPNYDPPQWQINLDYAAGIQHEYFHHYQTTHALDRGLDYQSDSENPDNTVNSPRWWTEGAPMAAEMWWLRSNWMNIDSLKDYIEVQTHITNNINDRNQSFWWFSQILQKAPPYVKPNGYEDPNDRDNCSNWMLGSEYAYHWPLPDSSNNCANKIAGSAPIHFMAHKSSWQAVLRDIPADYYEYGFWGAVEIHTGLNEQQFYDEFNAIMRSVDWTTIDPSYAPAGWNIPDESIEETVDFLNIAPYSLEDFPR